MENQQSQHEEGEVKVNVPPLVSMQSHEVLRSIGASPRGDDKSKQQPDHGNGANVHEEQRIYQALPIILLHSRAPYPFCMPRSACIIVGIESTLNVSFPEEITRMCIRKNSDLSEKRRFRLIGRNHGVVSGTQLDLRLRRPIRYQGKSAGAKPIDAKSDSGGLEGWPFPAI
jgi:hypothetical protein